MRNLATICLIALSPLVMQAQSSTTDNLTKRLMLQAHIPGAAVAIVRNGKVVSIHSYGMANLEYSTPVTAETPFQIASATKIYTSVLLMRMVEQKKLDLDAPVTRYLHDAPTSWAAITLRNLATHTSGLKGESIPPGTVATEDALKVAYKAKSIRKPGEDDDYASFDDYTVLQALLERVSGKSFPQLMHDELFATAGMTCSMFDKAEDRGPQRVAENVPGRAEYYRWIGNLNQRRWFLYTQYAYASGGVYSCAQDMAHLLALLDSGQILSHKSLQESQAAFTLLNGEKGGFGIGWTAGTYRGHRWAGHSGGPAFSDVMYFPDDHFGIVVLTNQQNLYPQIASLIADEFIKAPDDYAPEAKADDAPSLTVSLGRVHTMV
jgi:CubicO group peptidase (beta-lactamase class C family)